MKSNTRAASTVLFNSGRGFPRCLIRLFKNCRRISLRKRSWTRAETFRREIRVDVDGGAFAGMRGCVLRLMPARNRVEVLLDILGRQTPVQVDLCSVLPVKNDRVRAPLILAI